MKKIFYLILFVGICKNSQGQQKPYYTQYILNNYILNPAVTGIENYFDLKASYRKQWDGLDGAPVSSYLTIHGPIGKTDERTTATSFEKVDDNPYKSKVLENSDPASAHHGVGFSIISDKTGYITRTTATASYAYHLPINNTMMLSAGFMGGITNVSMDKTKIVWGSLNPNDPAVGINNGEIMNTLPELGAGLWLYGKNFFVGTSVLNIVPGKFRLVQNDKYGNSFKPHFFLQGGYRYFISDDVSVLPSFAIQNIAPLPMFIHANVKMQYQDLLWIGGGYRINDELSGIAFMSGINLARTLNFSYSYNSSPNSRLKNYVGNTHEFLIGLVLGNKGSDICPKNVW